MQSGAFLSHGDAADYRSGECSNPELGILGNFQVWFDQFKEV